jgi:uncharacterized membrane protein
MATTLLGVFDDPAAARRAIDNLRASPLELDDISIVSRGESGEHLSAGEGAAVGAVWGGLVGLAALLIPGVGPFIAGGALFAALTGAAPGAVVGGVAGALIDAGLGEEEARSYETMVHEGKTLVAVKSREEDTTEVRRILAQAGANSIRDNQTDISGTNAPVDIESDTATAHTPERELHEGATTVRGSSGMPPMSAPAAQGVAVVGVPGVNSTPITGLATGTRGIYDAPALTDDVDAAAAARSETTNMAAGTEDAYGTDETAAGDEGKAILAEGWDRVGSYGDRQGEQLDKDGEAERANRRP